MLHLEQRYTLSRRLSSFARRLVAPASSVSALPPRLYAARLVQFLEQVLP
jgi:hypothetical protein